MGRVARTSGVSLDKIASIRQAVFSLAFLGGPALAGVLLAHPRSHPGGLGDSRLLPRGRNLHVDSYR